MIPIHDERFLVNDRRTSFPVRMQSLHLTQVFLPDDFPLEIKAIQPTRTEKGIEELTIGDRRVGNRAACVVAAFMRKLLADDSLPNDVTVRSSNG